MKKPRVVVKVNLDQVAKEIPEFLLALLLKDFIFRRLQTESPEEFAQNAKETPLEKYITLGVK